MAMKLCIEIRGIPRPKQSFKYTRAGIKYRPKAVTDEQDSIRAQVIQQLPPGFKPFAGPVVMQAVFRFPVLKTMSKAIKAQIANNGIVPKVTKPDMDNLTKLLGDALEGVLYLNDSQVWKYQVMKIYAETPGIYINVEGT